MRKMGQLRSQWLLWDSHAEIDGSTRKDESEIDGGKNVIPNLKSEGH